jgi:hypothetical protein
MENDKIRLCGNGNVLFLFGADAVALRNKIYVKRSVWTKVPPYRKESMFIHESTHLIQQDNMGWLKWLVKYIFSKTFRLREEIAAYGNEMIYRMDHGEAEIKLMYAFSDLLSGKIYSNMIDFVTAYEKLHEYMLLKRPKLRTK